METTKTALDFCDVVIVGGGLSGLTTAYSLAERDPNLNVLILEKDEELGGILSVKSDIARKYITQDHHEVWDLTSKLGVEFQMKDTPKNHWRNFSEWYGMEGYLAKFEVLRFVNEIDMLCQEYNPKRSKKKHWNKTMKQFISNKLYFKRSKDFIRFIIKSVFGVDPQVLRVDEFLTVCFTCLTFSHMIDSLLDANYIPHKGWPELIKRLAKHLPTSYKMIRERCVTQIIEVTSDRLIVQTSLGENYQTHVVVMACPWQAVKQIKIVPPLWPPIMKRIENLESYVTIFKLAYRISPWDQKGHSGCVVDYENNLLCYETKPCVLSGALYHNSVLEDPFENITKILSSKFGESMMHPSEYKIKVYEHQILINFPEQEINRGAIVWASTNNSTRFRGFINGAIHSGMRAAIKTLSMIRPSTSDYYDIIDTDDFRAQTVGIIGRGLMSINIASCIRVIKIITVASLSYFLFQRYFKDYANIVAKFLKISK